MLKELCLDYDKATAEVEAKKAELDVALQARSKIVEAISKEIAPKKKFLRAGKEITIVIRGDTFFFRGSKQESGLVEVE